mmetsp:Transcript_37002/g.56722  ORF Transcript_37002/g.56722 Transcript_37002/m.56722 type:complete len:82 (-) Transcript_37002:1969-2214(-)
MNSASSKAYVSKKALFSLQQAKEKLQQKKKKKETMMKVAEKSDEDDSMSDEEYHQRQLSCECVSSDELDGGLNLSEEEDVE